MSKWIRNLQTALEHKAVVVLHGNVRDRYIDSKGRVYEKLTSLLHHVSAEVGRDFHERRSLFPNGDVTTEVLHSEPEPEPEPDPDSDRSASSDLGGGSEEYRRASDSAGRPRGDDDAVPCSRIFAAWADHVKQSTRPSFLVVHYLDKIVPFKQSYSEDELRCLYFLEKIIENITLDHRLVLVALSDKMVPLEVSTQSPKCRVISVPHPDKTDRERYLRNVLSEDHRHLILLSDITDGLHLHDLDGICTRIRKTPEASASDAHATVNRHRLGETEDYWGNLSIEDLSTARNWFINDEGVIGQDEAVDKVCDVLCRARSGLAGMASGVASKPKGVLFFAGPPGVGKNFLAKKTAKFLFSTEEAFVRIDMSELKDEHTMSKLIGSPPGYVGHEQGGVLTNAVLDRPFSVVLFDEIEKAHPSILDVFLQLLEDGRLTDSRGQTVFFTETLIVFTSNIGNRETDKQRLWEELERQREEGATNLDFHSVMRGHFVESVQRFFETEISRPELLRRIGTIVPFNYIRDEVVRRRIVESHLARILKEFEDRYRHRGFTLELIQPGVTDYLLSRDQADEEIDPLSDQSVRRQGFARFGASGITSVIEEELIDKLTRPVLRAEHLATLSKNHQRGFFVYAGDGELVVTDTVPVRPIQKRLPG